MEIKKDEVFALTEDNYHSPHTLFLALQDFEMDSKMSQVMDDEGYLCAYSLSELLKTEGLAVELAPSKIYNERERKWN